MPAMRETPQKCPIRELSIAMRSDKVHSAACGTNCPLFVEGEEVIGEGMCALTSIAKELKELASIIRRGRSTRVQGMYDSGIPAEVQEIVVQKK
jgi:hypothetical protein